MKEHKKASNFYNCTYVQKSADSTLWAANVRFGYSCRTFFGTSFLESRRRSFIF